MGLLSNYCARHGAGFRFQMAVPADLQGIVGRKMWRRYLAVRDEPEARLLSLHLASRCRKEIDRLRQRSDDGWCQASEPSNLQAASLDVGVGDGSVIAPSGLDIDAKWSPILHSAMKAPFVPLASLVDLWRRVAQPRAKFSVQRMKRSADEFDRLIGSVCATQVTRAHVMQYRDALESKAYSRSTAKQYLVSIHRLFVIGLSEGVVASNPAAGIKIRTGLDKFADRQRRRPFEPHELRSLCGALSSETAPFKWFVKLLVFHGMRSGEVAQLRVGDVTKMFGMLVIRVHDRHGSLKNVHSQRDIPLHPRCSEFVQYVRGLPGPWIFPQETWRSDRFQRYGADFLRKKVKLADRTLTMHSLRHTWRTLAREISMPSAVSRAIMGHAMGSDVHEAYGTRPSLRVIEKWMARIDPLGSVRP